MVASPVVAAGQQAGDFTFPREGNYYVEVTDARFSAQTQNFYRLKMGSYRYAEGVFPLGGRRGEQTPVTFIGGRSAGVKAAADLRSAAGAFPTTSLLRFCYRSAHSGWVGRLSSRGITSYTNII